MACLVKRHSGLKMELIKFLCNAFQAKALAFGIANLVAGGANADVIQLCTQSGQSIGVGLSDYTYEEPKLMSLKAKKISLNYSNIYALNGNATCSPDGWFAGGQVRYAVGNADYQSPISGSLNNTPNWYINTQFIMGKDTSLGSQVVSPHVGLGLRLLLNDLRTNDIRQGYRRDSRYLYMTSGATHKTQLQNTHVLSTTFEYMHLLKGVQRVSLSDQNLSAQNVRLKQSKGYGLSVETMLRAKAWSMGPVITYWKVEQSNVSGTPAVFEPANATLEIGFRINRIF